MYLIFNVHFRSFVTITGFEYLVVCRWISSPLLIRLLASSSTYLIVFSFSRPLLVGKDEGIRWVNLRIVDEKLIIKKTSLGPVKLALSHRKSFVGSSWTKTLQLELCTLPSTMRDVSRGSKKTFRYPTTRVRIAFVNCTRREGFHLNGLLNAYVQFP